jgi:hypothetical protein
VPVSPPIDTGSLAVVVNEGGSEVLLSRADRSASSDLIFASPNASSLISRILPAGSYNLLVKKPGYFDEARNVLVIAGKRRKVVISLRPKMALLNVSTNVADAEIEIENVGKFTHPLRKYRIKPGSYRINIQRRGFIPQTITADLRIPAREQNITVVLEPVRIDSVLAQAYEKINGGDYRGAAELTNDVLRLNPAHAKANLLFGLSGFYRGDVSSATYFLRAIRNGESVKFTVKILDEIGGFKLTEAELSLNRDYISFRTSGRVDLNFRIAKADVSELQRAFDRAFMNYIVLKGKGDTYGRPIEQRMTLYSGIAALRPNLKEAYCQAPAAGRSCSSDIDIIYKLISNWRPSPPNNTAAK